MSWASKAKEGLPSCFVAPVRPLHGDVLLYPEPPEEANARTSFLHVVDPEAGDFRGGYHDAAHRALVLAVGHEVRELKAGDVVLLPSVKNWEDHAIRLDDKTLCMHAETTVLAVLEGEGS